MKQRSGWAGGLLILSLLLAGPVWAQEIHIEPGSASGAPAAVTPLEPSTQPAAPAAAAAPPAPPAAASPAPATSSAPSAANSAPATATGTAPAGKTIPTRPPIPTIDKNVNLVLVPVTITDPMNRMVTGLDENFFTVLEDDVRQRITSFSSDDAPISVGVIFDDSGSMSDKIEKSREALQQFFKTANPQDEFFLIDFSDEPRLLCTFTSDIDQVDDSVNELRAHGRTALLDAVYLGLDQMRQARYTRKALLIISDGGDNHSRYTEREVLKVVREADVQIYAIGIFSPAGERGTAEEQEGPAMLNDITDATGGRTFAISDVDELPDVATKIGIELRNEYVLGYSPSNDSHDGKWRKIQVKLHPPAGLPPLTVSARTGYYGPQ